MKNYSVTVVTEYDNYIVEILAYDAAEAVNNAAIYVNYEMDIDFSDIQDVRVNSFEEVDA